MELFYFIFLKILIILSNNFNLSYNFYYIIIFLFNIFEIFQNSNILLLIVIKKQNLIFFIHILYLFIHYYTPFSFNQLIIKYFIYKSTNKDRKSRQPNIFHGQAINGL